MPAARPARVYSRCDRPIVRLSYLDHDSNLRLSDRGSQQSGSIRNGSRHQASHFRAIMSCTNGDGHRRALPPRITRDAIAGLDRY